MKTLSWNFALVGLLIVSGIAGCAAPASPPPPTRAAVPPATPTDHPKAAIVKDLVRLLNAGDIEGSLAYFADDAMGYVVGLPPTGMEVYTGKAQLRALWEDSVANHFQSEIQIIDVLGDTVSVQSKTWHDFTREIGVAPLEWIDIYEFKGGKIVTYSTTITKEALARLRPALAEVMPPAPTAVPSSDPPVAEMSVTIEAGTCTTDNTVALRAGEVSVTLDVKDQDNSLYALTIFSLDAEKDLLDLMAATVGLQPTWSDMLLYKELGPGSREVYTFTIKQGPVYLICWSRPPELPIGNVGPLSVVP